MKSVQTRSFSAPYFPVFGLNTDQKNSVFGQLLGSEQSMKELICDISLQLEAVNYFRKKAPSIHL